MLCEQTWKYVKYCETGWIWIGFQEITNVFKEEHPNKHIPEEVIYIYIYISLNKIINCCYNIIIIYLDYNKYWKRYFKRIKIFWEKQSSSQRY
jgi:hypothetical protein